MQSLKINPFSFNGRSGNLNFLVYGIVLPVILVLIGYLSQQPLILIGSIVLSVIILFTAMVRRGRDAGHTPTATIITYVLSSSIISGIMDATYISLKIMLAVDNSVLGMVIIGVIQNIYLVYLLLADKSEKEVPKTSNVLKVILILFGVIIGVGILAAVVIPKLSV